MLLSPCPFPVCPCPAQCPCRLHPVLQGCGTSVPDPPCLSTMSHDDWILDASSPAGLQEHRASTSAPGREPLLGSSIPGVSFSLACSFIPVYVSLHREPLGSYLNHLSGNLFSASTLMKFLIMPKENRLPCEFLPLEMLRVNLDERQFRKQISG